MALKGSRYTTDDLIDYFMNEVAEAGGPVVLSTVGSGAALDDAAALVTYGAGPAQVSGVSFVGALMNDMVNIDQTRQHINFNKDEIQIGGKVAVLTRGWIVTDRIMPGVTPAINQAAYVGPSGYWTNVYPPDYGSRAGLFMSTKDEDGYAKIFVKGPNLGDT